MNNINTSPKTSTIFTVLSLSQIAFALWDIISREVFDRHVHPFLPPLPFLALRTCLAAGVNVIFAFIAEGTSSRNKLKNHRRTDKTSSGPNKSVFSVPPSQFKLFVTLNTLAFLGLTSSRILYQAGRQITTSTHAAAIQPLIAPATTVLVLAIGLEQRDTHVATATAEQSTYRKYSSVLFI